MRKLSRRIGMLPPYLFAPSLIDRCAVLSPPLPRSNYYSMQVSSVLNGDSILPHDGPESLIRRGTSSLAAPNTTFSRKSHVISHHSLDRWWMWVAGVINSILLVLPPCSTIYTKFAWEMLGRSQKIRIYWLKRRNKRYIIRSISLASFLFEHWQNV